MLGENDCISLKESGKGGMLSDNEFDLIGSK